MNMDTYIGKDEKALKNMLDSSTDFEERRKLRAAIRDIRNKRFRTVAAYDSPASAASGSIFQAQPPSVAAATCPPPEEAILQAPVTERVRIVRKAQSFNTAKEVSTLNNVSESGAAINNKSEARNFLSKQLSFMAADHVDLNGIGAKPVGRSQSFKILASKFENNSLPLSTSWNKSNGSGTDGNHLKSASSIVETDQVVSSVTVGRTHSLKLPTYRDNSPSQNAPIGSLAHSYSEKAKRLMSGSDSDLTQIGRFSLKEKQSLVGNRRIRPFLKADENNPKEDNNKSGEINQSEVFVTNKKSSFRHSAPFFTDFTNVRRASSLKNPVVPFFDGDDVKIQRAGSFRTSYKTHNTDEILAQNDSQSRKEECTNVSGSAKADNISSYTVPSKDNSLLNTREHSAVVSRENSLMESGENSLVELKEHSTLESSLSSSFEEQSAKKRADQTSVSNPYEGIEDERTLDEMLKNAEDLDERINIRAALHKLRQNHLANKNSPPRKSETSKSTYTTKLEQNKAALQSLIQGNIMTTSTQLSNHETSQNSSLTSNQSNEDDDVFKTFRNNHGKRSQSSSDVPSEYCNIQSEDELQNLLNQTTDYFERKKIRTALTALKRRHSLAEVEKLKGKHSRSKSAHHRDNNNHINHQHDNSNFHGNHLDNDNKVNNILDTGQENVTIATTTKTSTLNINNVNKRSEDEGTENNSETNLSDRLLNSDDYVSEVNGLVPSTTGIKSRDTKHQQNIAWVEIQSTGINKQHNLAKQGSDENLHHQQGCDLDKDNHCNSNISVKNSTSDSHYNNLDNHSSLTLNGSLSISTSKQNSSGKVKRKLPEIPSNVLKGESSICTISSDVSEQKGLKSEEVVDYSDYNCQTNKMDQLIVTNKVGDVVNHNQDPSDPSVGVLHNEDLHNGNVILMNSTEESSLSQHQGLSPKTDTVSFDDKSETEVCSADSSSSTNAAMTTTVSLGLESGVQQSVNSNSNDVDSGVGSSEGQRDKFKLSPTSSPDISESTPDKDERINVTHATMTDEKNMLRSLDELRDELEELEKQLRDSCDFDERKQLRAEIRRIRILIRDGDFILRTPRYQPEDSTLSCSKQTALEKISILTDTNQNSISYVHSQDNNKIETDQKAETMKQTEADDRVVELRNSSSRRVESKSTENNSNQSINNKPECDINDDDNVIKKDICDNLNNQKVRNNSNNKDSVSKRGPMSKQSHEDAFSVLKHKLHKKTQRKSSEGYVIVDIVDEKVVVNSGDNNKTTVNDDLNKTRRSSQDIYTCEDIGDYVDIELESKKEKTEELVVISDEVTSKTDVQTLEGHTASKQSSEDDIPEVTAPLSDIIAIDAESAILTCKIAAPSKADITWYKETRILIDTPEFKQIRDDDVCSLTIPEVFPDDEGEYRCVAKANGGEAETSCYLLIKVHSKSLRWRTRLPRASTPRRKRRTRKNKLAVLPLFPNALQDITVDDGTEVVLKCQVNAKPTPRIYWYHGVELLKNHTEMKQEFKDGWAMLTIPEVFAEDAGKYTCAAKNVAGESRCSCTVTVTDKTPSPYTPPPEDEPPELMIEAEFQDLTEGDCLTLICRVSGSPSPCIVWKKDNKTIEASKSCHIDATDSQASLVIFKALTKDDGVYECIAKNNAGTASVTAVVTVKAKPKQSKLPSSCSSPAKITRSQPVSKTSDLRNKHRSSSSSSQKDESNKLRSSSTSSTKDIEVFKEPNVKKYQQTEKVTLETDKDEKLEKNDSKSVSSTRRSFTKDIKQIKEPLPIEKSNIVPIIDPPRILEPLTDHLEITLDEKFCLECRFNYLSQKTVVAWFKDGIELPKVGRIKWSVEKAYTKLWINRASKGDVGNYRVLIKNGGGEASSRCQVKFKAVIAPVRAKLEPKQVDEKANNLLNNVLGHMITNKQPAGRGQTARHDDHTKHLVNLIKSHRDPDKETHNHKYIVHIGTGDYSTQNGDDHDDKPHGLETLHEGKELKMSSNITAIDDEDTLYDMMSKTDNFDERKKIRTRLREIREKKADDYDKRRQEREANREDAIQMKLRQAEADKQRRMKAFDNMAKQPKKELTAMEERIREKHAAADVEKQRKMDEFKEMGAVMSKAYHSGSDQITLDTLKKAEDDKSRKMAEFKEDAVSRSTRTENVPGGTMTTSTSKTTHTSKDGSTVTTTQTKHVTQTGSIGGTSYNISKTSADDAAKRLCDTFSNKALESTSGILTVKTEAWSSKDGITHRNEKTKTWGAKQGPRGAMAAFKQMDNTANAGKPKFRGSTSSTGSSTPSTPTSPTSPDGVGRVGIQRSPSAIKDMLLQWIKKQVDGYPNVNVTNFSSSWNDGMAFCALIHHFHPEAFDFSKLDPKRRRANFKLAFDVAEKVADISPLLEVEDMVRMKNPDWKCVFTYVQSFYRKFRDHDANKTAS